MCTKIRNEKEDRPWIQEHKLLVVWAWVKNFYLNPAVCFSKCGQKLGGREKLVCSLLIASLFPFPKWKRLWGTCFINSAFFFWPGDWGFGRCWENVRNQLALAVVFAGRILHEIFDTPEWIYVCKATSCKPGWGRGSFRYKSPALSSMERP